MMMQMLDAGGMTALTDNIRTPDEDNPKGYYEFEAVKQVKEDSAWVADACGKVVKMVYRLLYDLPSGYDYQVVFMKRKLDEVIASQEEMLQRNGKASDAIDPAQLADIYQRRLDEARSWLDKQPNFRVIYVDYRDVLDRPDRVVDDLNAFLGGSLDTGAMRRVPDGTLYRQRR